MNNRKNTAKGALLTSIVALLLCFAMLFGTTFAWFTDIVESNDATLIAGVLDIEMTHTSKSVTTEEDVTEDGVKLFEDVTLWEPGAVTWENFHIYNKGDLALKYMFSANFTDENYVDANGTQKGLSDILKIAFIENGIDMATATRESVLAQAQGKGTLLKSTQFNGSMEVTDDPKTIGVIIYWEPGATDNDFNLSNGKTTVDGAKALKIDLGMTVVATQLDYENDSFDNQYDVNAAYPVVLPDNTDFTQNTGVAVDGQGNYYATLSDAIASGASTLYFNPGTDLGNITHLNVTDDLTIYGNNAYISGGEKDLAIDIYANLTKDITINIYNLDGIAIWGSRVTEHTLNVNLYGCEDVSRIYLSGTSGVNNINLQNCTANKDTLVGDTVVYSNANGTITINNCTFTNIGCPVNLNHKIAGEQTVNVTNTTFVDCATEGTAAYYAPIRLYNSEVGANQTLTATGNTFTYSAGKAAINGADVLLNVLHSGNEASGTIDASVQYDAVVKSGLNVNLITTGALSFAEFSSVLSAANGVVNSDDVVIIKDSQRNYQNNKTCQFFLGADVWDSSNTIETLNITGVTFIFMDDDTSNAYTSGELQVFSNDMTFTDCTFIGTSVSPWGAASTGADCETAKFIDCTFKDLSGRYAIHQNMADTLVVEDCTFENCERGIHTNSRTPISVTITGNTFTGLGDSYAMLCLAENGDIGNATLNITGNDAAGQTLLRQLNTTTTLAQVTDIIAKNTHGADYVTGSVVPTV